MKSIIPLIARIFVAAIFLMAGAGKIANPAGTQEYMAAHGMPYTWLFLLGAIVVEILGGLSLVLGLKARLGAWVLALFLVPTTLIFHTEFSDQMQLILFMENIAIIGGLLMIASCGPGRLSMDRRG
ncbi:hypothetical protein AMJ39_08680 [candidate division TA06 bacterium DG_24]|uniref:DoxX family protein n=1 Tax=candidate division TA06 bacterium DG_24 TaxID=1703770 RepID=A0A0S7WPJ0_UNCT6|nr:MAG: hypothetical protein AMJ39_08680 [candidate division TA06 bacterium DG_24]